MCARQVADNPLHPRVGDLAVLWARSARDPAHTERGHGYPRRAKRARYQHHIAETTPSGQQRKQSSLLAHVTIPDSVFKLN